MRCSADPDDWRAGGFGIYIHWPFCESKCPYCDFNSHVAKHIDQDRWRRAYLAEIDRHARLLPGRVVNSIFFGGGTPSLMDPATTADILSAIRAAWPMANDCEITLEANPGSVEAGRFAAYADAGVNRVSLGVQALNDRDLRRLGRLHGVDDAMRALEIARTTFGRISFDLIYARQDQTLADWRQELSRALELAGDHISLYQLTIEDGTAFAERFRHGGLRGLPDEGLASDLYETTLSMAEDAGYHAYEVSNLARPGAESRHNTIYWRYGDYVGIGPGAHGRITLQGRRHATEAWRMPDRWLAAVDGGNGNSVDEVLTPQDEIAEFLLMGLRLSEGIDLTRLHRLGHTPDRATLDHLQAIGMHEISGDRLHATRNGRMVLNTLVAELLPG